MVMTEAERLALIRDIAAEVRKSIPTASQIAREVLDSKTSDLVKDGTDIIRVKTALERLLTLARARR